MPGFVQAPKRTRAFHLAAADAPYQPVAHVRLRASGQVELADYLLHSAFLLIHVFPVAAHVPAAIVQPRQLGHRGEHDRLAHGRAAKKTVLLLNVRGVLLEWVKKNTSVFP